jgi:hypothetical protein
VADRSSEHLGASDEGVILLRNKFFSEIKRVAGGAEPFGLVDDASNEAGVPLPFMGRQYLLDNRAQEKEGYDAVQRSVMEEHVISGLSEDTLQQWTDVFGEPPRFHVGST